MDENELSFIVVDAAVEVHRDLGGPGLLESVYEEALAWELDARGVPVQRQKLVRVRYKGRQLATPLRVDLVVGERLLVECKAASQTHRIFKAQLLTYLRATGIRLGLLINFGERLVRDGIHRVVNGL